MKISILTLFPGMFSGPFSESIIKRAIEKKLVEIELINLRDFGEGSRKTVDDRPYGGGVGMVMRVDVVERAISATHNQQLTTNNQKAILLDPTGKVFNQKIAKRLSKLDHLILICGHYEGIDSRIEKFSDEVISIGDYILTGGEIPGMVVVDSVVRLLPGVLIKPEAVKNESFSELASKGETLRGWQARVLEYPQYTRPEEYKGLKVPKILLSGNHREIEKWRLGQALTRTKKRRPDLLLQRL